MNAKGRTRAALRVTILLASLGVFLGPGEKPKAAQNWSAGLELLVNGSFDGALEPQGPAGWFKAVASAQTDNLHAGIEPVPQRGNVVFIEQAGVKVKVANNWAQRVQTIPVGATVRIAADVEDPKRARGYRLCHGAVLGRGRAAHRRREFSECRAYWRDRGLEAHLL